MDIQSVTLVEEDSPLVRIQPSLMAVRVEVLHEMDLRPASAPGGTDR